MLLDVFLVLDPFLDGTSPPNGKKSIKNAIDDVVGDMSGEPTIADSNKKEGS